MTFPTNVPANLQSWLLIFRGLSTEGAGTLLNFYCFANWAWDCKLQRSQLGGMVSVPTVPIMGGGTTQAPHTHPSDSRWRCKYICILRDRIKIRFLFRFINKKWNFPLNPSVPSNYICTPLWVFWKTTFSNSPSVVCPICTKLRLYWDTPNKKISIKLC